MQPVLTGRCLMRLNACLFDPQATVAGVAGHSWSSASRAWGAQDDSLRASARLEELAFEVESSQPIEANTERDATCHECPGQPTAGTGAVYHDNIVAAQRIDRLKEYLTFIGRNPYTRKSINNSIPDR